MSAGAGGRQMAWMEIMWSMSFEGDLLSGGLATTLN
jgi:hypothetical protein